VVVGAQVDPKAILEAFGLGTARGVVSLTLKIAADNFAELTTTRYITETELEALSQALQEFKPTNLDVIGLSVVQPPHIYKE
jgi:hypothetical protein